MGDPEFAMKTLLLFFIELFIQIHILISPGKVSVTSFLVSPLNLPVNSLSLHRIRSSASLGSIDSKIRINITSRCVSDLTFGPPLTKNLNRLTICLRTWSASFGVVSLYGG